MAGTGEGAPVAVLEDDDAARAAAAAEAELLAAGAVSDDAATHEAGAADGSTPDAAAAEAVPAGELDGAEAAAAEEDRRTDRRESARDKIDRLERENTELRAEVAALRTEVAELRSTIVALTEEVRRLGGSPEPLLPGDGRTTDTDPTLTGRRTDLDPTLMGGRTDGSRSDGSDGREGGGRRRREELSPVHVHDAVESARAEAMAAATRYAEQLRGRGESLLANEVFRNMRDIISTATANMAIAFSRVEGERDTALRELIAERSRHGSDVPRDPRDGTIILGAPDHLDDAALAARSGGHAGSAASRPGGTPADPWAYLYNPDAPRPGDSRSTPALDPTLAGGSPRTDGLDPTLVGGSTPATGGLDPTLAGSAPATPGLDPTLAGGPRTPALDPTLAGGSPRTGEAAGEDDSSRGGRFRRAVDWAGRLVTPEPRGRHAEGYETSERAPFEPLVRGSAPATPGLDPTLAGGPRTPALDPTLAGGSPRTDGLDPTLVGGPEARS